MVGKRNASTRSAWVFGALIAVAAARCANDSDDDATTGDHGANAGEAAEGGSSGASSGSGGLGGTSAGRGGAPSGGVGPTVGGDGGVGATSGGEGGEPSAGGSGGMVEVQFFSVASFDGYLKPPPPVCTGEWIDFGCDESGTAGAGGSTGDPFACDVPDKVISFDARDGRHCPYCAPPAPGDADRSCPTVRNDYGDFLSDIVSASCANYCESDADCFAWEIDNACGDFVISLRGLIDEEPIAFAEQYALTHCGVCGTQPQSIYMRRPGSDVISGGSPPGNLLERFAPHCLEQRCVLARDEH